MEKIKILLNVLYFEIFLLLILKILFIYLNWQGVNCLLLIVKERDALFWSLGDTAIVL